MNLETEKTILRELQKKDLTDEYLSWLNDAEVNYYSRRRYKKTTREEMEDYFEKFDRKSGAFFAIIDKGKNKHIGNITVTNVNKEQNIGEIAILLGDKESWGKGFGSDAWKLMTGYAFEVLNFRKLTAGTFNPAMARILEKQGWELEGIFKEEFSVGNKYLDKKVFGLLKRKHES